MRTIPSSELIINDDGSIFHLHLKPEQLADTVLLVGDPGRVEMVASYFDTQECRVANREFVTITGTYRGKRLSVISTGIGNRQHRCRGNGVRRIGKYRLCHTTS